MRFRTTGEHGRRSFELGGFDLRTHEDMVLVSLHYIVNGGQHGESTCATLALTPKQGAQFAGALQAQILALKGTGPRQPMRIWH